MKRLIIVLLTCLPASTIFGQSYLFFLHGRIIEDQGRKAVDTVNGYGAYEYDDMLDAFKNAGFLVLSEVRPKNTNPFEYARKIANQVDSLLKKGVHPDDITVVGASKGAIISMVISTYVKNKDVNFVFMGGCDDEIFKNYTDIQYYGNVLSIYEKTDKAGSCFKFQRKAKKTIGHYKEIELNTGLKHGYLYKAMDEWILPAVKWANKNYTDEFIILDPNFMKGIDKDPFELFIDRCADSINNSKTARQLPVFLKEPQFDYRNAPKSNFHQPAPVRKLIMDKVTNCHSLKLILERRSPRYKNKPKKEHQIEIQYLDLSFYDLAKQRSAELNCK